jgi:hypothetical protein
MSDRKTKDEPSEETKSETSRREWLLQLGKAAVLYGFTGSASEIEARAVAAMSALTPEAQSLPPGLYLPSGEHMAHVLIRDERFVKIPPGTETDFVRPREGPFQPQFFRADEFRAMQQMVRLILGDPGCGSAHCGEEDFAQTVAEIAEWLDLALSQAGAVREAARNLSADHRALAVQYYGKERVERLETAAPEVICRDGLKWFDSKATENHAKPFLELEEDAQVRLIESAIAPGKNQDQEDAGAKFIHYLKTQALRGFYTSRLGIQELGYKGNAFYTDCPGCKS